jgi:O-antigen/teichoic acid export membrane protein
VRWAFVESLVSAAASLGTVLVLARFVGPAEFGLAAIAVAVTALVQPLLLGGMPDALVRSPSAHRRFTDALFWATLGIGAVAALLVAAVGLGVGLAFDSRRLGALIAVQGLTLVAIGAAAAPTGLLLRKLRTRALVNRTLASKLAGLAVAASAAIAGLGAWAVILGNVAAQGVAAAQLLLTMRRPRLRLADPALVPALRLGLLSGTQQTLGALSSRGFILAYGAVYGAYAVGLFNFALRLVEEAGGLVLQTLRRVTVTAFAAARRQGLDLEPLFMRGTNSIAWVTAPLFLLGAAVAPDAVPLLFGPQWQGAVPILQLLLFLWVIRSVRMLVNAVMMVEGRQREMVGFGVAGLVATACGFVLSLPFGIAWTNASYALTLVGVIFGGSAFARATGIGARRQVAAFATPFLLALGSAGSVVLLRLGPLADWSPLPRLLVAGSAGLALFTGLALLIDREGLVRVAGLLRRR